MASIVPSALRGRKDGSAILSIIDPQDRAFLSPYLQPVELKFRQRLETVNRRTSDIYFIESGLVSVIGVGRGSRAHQAEVALLGPEGFTGVTALLGIERSPYEAMVLRRGQAQQISAHDLRRLADERATLRAALMKFVHCFIVQLAQTALASATAKIEQRMARWLLMAHDRIGSGEVELTHEALAFMLGTRRAGVTIALNRMKSDGLIANTRGRVTILDRTGLMAIANGFYGMQDAELLDGVAGIDLSAEQPKAGYS